MKHRFEDSPNYIEYNWRPGWDVNPIRARQEAEWLAKPEAARTGDFDIPPTMGNYLIGVGDWITGTHHHRNYPHLITSVTIRDNYWEHWKWSIGREAVGYIPTYCFMAIRLDDFVKYKGRKVPSDEQMLFGGFVPQDDHMTEIHNWKSGQIKLWKVSTPQQAIDVMQVKQYGQLSLFT